MADLTNTITDAAGGPSMVSVDGETVKARSIDELIKADRYLAAKAAAAAGKTGIRFSKIVPGSAAGTPTTQGR